MYFARYKADRADVCQALVKTSFGPDGGAGINVTQARRLTGIAGDFAVRTLLRAGQLERVWFLNAETSRETELARELESLRSRPDSRTEVAVDKPWHDRVAGDFPTRHLAWMRPGGYRAGEYALATEFRLHSILDTFYESAARLEWDIVYQFNAASYWNHAEDNRYLRKRLASMELDEAFPRDLLVLQQSIFGRAAEPGFLIDEFIGCEQEQAWEHLLQIVEDEFALRLKRFNFDATPLETLPEEMREDALETGFEVEFLEESNPVARVASAVNVSELEEMSAWTPRIADAAAFQLAAAPMHGEVSADVFISYSSRDAEVATHVQEYLERRGVQCWIAPRDIRAGASYPGEIARALQRCKSLVLLFSEHSNVSPHVQREVERAVSRALPVLTLKLDDAPMSDSMEYLISTPHCLSANNPPTSSELERMGDDVLSHLQR